MSMLRQQVWYIYVLNRSTYSSQLQHQNTLNNRNQYVHSAVESNNNVRSI
jgi:hypothetical protein